MAASGDLYYRFRKRITFPIRNEQGRMIAFTARALDSGEKAGPKYLNSPETPLYTKGNVLFNLDLAKTTLRQYNFALLVEGQMDCIRAYISGVPNVLATSGTAFTETQVRLLSRFTQRVVVNFDPGYCGGECGGEIYCAAGGGRLCSEGVDAGRRAGSGSIYSRAGGTGLCCVPARGAAAYGLFD